MCTEYAHPVVSTTSQSLRAGHPMSACHIGGNHADNANMIVIKTILRKGPELEKFPKSPNQSASITDEKLSKTMENKALVQAKTIKTVARLLEILSVPKEQSLSNEELCRKFYGLTETAYGLAKPPEGELRNIQRYTLALSKATEEGPALIEKVVTNQKRGAHKFYHKPSHITHWLMTEEAALNILLTKQILGRAFGSVTQIGMEETGQIADKVAGASKETLRIRERLRVVPDGIGRMPADIKPEVLQPIVNAVAQNKQLSFSYRSSKGMSSERTVSPQGLVAKDGTIYLLATEGLSDIPRFPYPLQRISRAEVSHKPCQERPDFNLDRYIQDSHQLSHVLDGKTLSVELKLRVLPDALYHFKERPLSAEQDIGKASPTDGSCIVTANIPSTVLLVPFLLSMGGWIEVLGPPEVRKEVAKRGREIAAHYVVDQLD